MAVKKARKFQMVGTKAQVSNKPKSSLPDRARKGTFQVGEETAKLSLSPQSPVDERVRSKGRFQVSETVPRMNTAPSPVRDDIPMAEQMQVPKGARR